MIESIALVLRRLCACGLLCGVALTLVKDGSQQMLLRLCCACLMVITLFTTMPQMRWGDLQDSWKEPQLEQQAQEAVATSAQAQVDAICQESAQYLEAQGAALGYQVKARVEARLLQGNRLEITQVQYTGRGDAGKLTQLAVESLGVSPQQVLFTQEAIDEKK